MRYKKSFEILEKYVPDAKYTFASGTIVSSVRNDEIKNYEDRLSLISMGWQSYETWCLTL